jgi:hypothetical protein
MRGKALKFVVCAALTTAATYACALSAKLPVKGRTPVKAAAAPVRAGRKSALAPTHVSAKALRQPVATAKDKRGRPVAIARTQDVRRPVRMRAPEPAPEERPLEPITVNHDRKRHYSADPAPLSPVLYRRRGRLIMPAALKGSREILLRQNEIADSEGLARVQDDEDLNDLRESKLLVPVPAVQGLISDERLPANRRYCRPWTAQFLAALARAHYARFHTALQVNSAVRTVEFQRNLLLTNGNAAPAEGETASPHLTGQAIDLGKKGLSLTEIAWLRGYLLPLVQAGKVDVEEEFQQACFHISVYRKYLPEPAPKREIAQPHHGVADVLATAIR